MPKITKAERIAMHKEWEERISEFQSSGQTRRVWCEANHNVSVHQFQYWFGKLSRLESMTRPQLRGPWTQIQVEETVQGGGTRIQSSLSVRIGPAVIEVQDGYSPALLLDVVKVLQELC